MKKPKLPIAPEPWRYEASTESRYIYSYRYISDEDYEEEDDEEREDFRFVGLPKLGLNEINLKWLCDQVPEGVRLEDVKVELEEDRYCTEVRVNFYYDEKLPGKPDEYKWALKKYEEEMEVYKRDLKTYNNRKKQKEIKELEMKLNKLKEKK